MSDTSVVTAGGYTIGPTLTDQEAPWPVTWEQDARIDDGHGHEWESVLLQAGPGRWRVDEVIRCGHCHAPRCSGRNDPDPCMERRHHRCPHRLLRGTVYPVGGIGGNP